MTAVYLSVFGLVGIFSRYYIGIFFKKHLTLTFPADIFLINILGAFLIGIIYCLDTEKLQINYDLKVGIMVGFLGGFTTFSSFCLDTVKLLNSGKLLQAALYFSLSPLLGLFFTFLAIYLTKKIF